MRLRALALAVAAAAACSTPYQSGEPEDAATPADGGFDSATATTDAGGGDAEAGAGEAGATCDWTKPFGAPVFVKGVNSTTDEDSDARLSADELTVIFSSDRGMSPKRARIWYAVRADVSKPFGPPILVLEDGAEAIFDPAVTADGKTIYVQQGNVGLAARLRFASRVSAAGTFGPFQDLVSLDAPGEDERDPYITADGTFVFSRNATSGTVAGDLWTAQRGTAGTFTGVAPIAGLSTPSIDRNPVLSEDALEIFFSSDRNATGDLRIWRATRDARTDPFTTPSPVTELTEAMTANGYDAPTWLSPDRCVLYMASDRAGTTDIYRASRPQ